MYKHPPKPKKPIKAKILALCAVAVLLMATAIPCFASNNVDNSDPPESFDTANLYAPYAFSRSTSFGSRVTACDYVFGRPSVQQAYTASDVWYRAGTAVTDYVTVTPYDNYQRVRWTIRPSQDNFTANASVYSLAFRNFTWLDEYDYNGELLTSAPYDPNIILTYDEPATTAGCVYAYVSGTFSGHDDQIVLTDAPYKLAGIQYSGDGLDDVEIELGELLRATLPREYYSYSDVYDLVVDFVLYPDDPADGALADVDRTFHSCSVEAYTQLATPDILNGQFAYVTITSPPEVIIPPEVDTLGLFDWIVEGLDGLFHTPLIPIGDYSITIGSIVALFLGMALVLAFLKFFAGG